MSAVYSLESERVQTARQHFYECRRRGRNASRCQLGFDELYQLFCNEGNDMLGIARRAGISETSMAHLYENHFMALFENRTPEERRLRVLAERKARRLKRLAMIIPDRPWLKAVERQAGEWGHATRCFLGPDRNGRLQPRLQSIVVSGCRCQTYWVKGARKRQGTRHQRIKAVSLRRELLEAAPIQLFVILISGWRETTLVIPSQVLLERLFSDGRDRTLFFIPFQIQPPAHKNSRARMRPWEYEGRWDLVPLSTI
jgi:hypothetical protein